MDFLLMAIKNTIKAKAWRFFKENAGYCTPPGRVVCAMHLAKAEYQAQQIGMHFEWYPDEGADWSWLDQKGWEKEKAKTHEVYYCLAKDRNGEVVAALHGIFDPDLHNYRRVVEAELASEALSR